jgi:hypothetical protein
MHPVAHAVEIPLDQLERILLNYARKAHDGSVDIDVRVSQDAVRLVEMEHEAHEFQSAPSLKSPAWGDIGVTGPFKPPVDCEAIVRAMIYCKENEGKLRLVSSVRKIVAHFSKGELKKLVWVVPGELK